MTAAPASDSFPSIRDASDADIAAALESASVPSLMAAMMRISGDYSLLDGPLKPQQAVLAEVQGFMSEGDKREIRRRAVQVIADYRDRGCTLPPPPDRDTTARLMNFVVGEETPIGDVYLDLMQEEMELDDTDHRRVVFEAPLSPEQAQQHRALIIGAGMSGLLAAIRFKQAGIPFTILEKNSDVGGTWFENRYPGCRVDIASHFYSYSFEPGNDWQHFFSERDAVFDYFSRIADKYALREHIEFGAAVETARFDEAGNEWQVEYRSSGSSKKASARYLVSAVGQLNRPKIPELPGIDRFQGVAMHTARWDSSVDLSGKRVAVVGSGASAFQLVPELAKTVAELKVFQRSPPWMFPNPIYHEKVAAGKRWCLDNLPWYQKFYRFLLFWPGSDGAYAVLETDPDWDDGGKSINAASAEYRAYLEAYIGSQVSDPDLLAKVIPDYPPMGKRMLQDNGSWLGALQQSHVQLIDRAVSALDESGVIDADGNHHAVDAVIWATGFQADQFLAPMQIIGRNGVDLRAQWGDEPVTHLGIHAAGFPNLFLLYGPNTNVAHAGSVIFVSECQVKRMLESIKLAVESGATCIEVKPAVQDDYDQRLRAVLKRMVWQHPKVRNWYQNASGRVTSTLPWLLADYWRWTSCASTEELDID